MRSKCLVWLAGLFLIVGTAACNRPDQSVGSDELEQLDACAYEMRYRDVKETERLAHEALRLSGRTDVAAWLNLAYVAYQRMDFDGVEQILREVRKNTHNQVYLLCADVMTMKAVQRTGDYTVFFKSMYDAQRRMKRIDEEHGDLSGQERVFWLYSCSEFHIIASTYYYYQGQEALSKEHIREVEENYLSTSDTAQWIYYNYMLGSGGLVEAPTAEAVTLTEFDRLITTYRLSHKKQYLYFEGNALQSLAQMVGKHYELLQASRPEELHMLEARMRSVGPDDLSLALCQRAIDLFTAYDDMFQMACCHRTMGQLLFSQGRYDEALNQYAQALHQVNRHHLNYYHCSDTLVLFDEHQPETGPEAEWLLNERVKTVPEWIAGIREQISQTYSALGMKWASDYNRNAYLDILQLTNQNDELEVRRAQLQGEQGRLQVRTISVILLFLGLLVMLWAYRRRVSKRVSLLRRRLDDLQSGAWVPGSIRALQEQDEEAEEQLAVSRMQLVKCKQQNVVGRARVSLVHAILPFLDRVKGEVIRMKKDGEVSDYRRTYILELVTQIADYNEVLTEWIRVRQGQLAPNIRTVDLGRLFRIVGEGRLAFEQKGVSLRVNPTNLQVKADEALTLFMINTLADNARKFTPQGGRVEISAQATEDYVEVSVSDTGVGLSAEDMDTLNNSQVYDPATIGTPESNQKGFGFGLANCRGIIEKYKKHSELFHASLFGVRPNAPTGCTFFFRLPRVLGVVLVCLLLPLSGLAQTAEDLYDSLYHANLRGDYALALDYGDEALAADSLDARTEMGIRNEMALAALALNDWEAYEVHNARYTQLQKQLNQDTSLPEYVKRMEAYHRNSRLLLVFIVLLLMGALWLVYKLFVNRRLLVESDVQRQLDALQQTQEQTLQKHISLLTDGAKQNAFELQRIYVQNQVLGNCLSTIKHESMYYPARIRHLAQDLHGGEDVALLEETVNYYRHIFSILMQQADDQVAQPGFKRQRLPIYKVREMLETALRKGGWLSANEKESAGVEGEVIADSVLLEYFCQQLVQGLADRQYLSPAACSVRSSVSADGRFAQCELNVCGKTLNDEQIAAMFEPSVSGLPLYVARQIIREHDTYSGNPGLRLLARSTADGYQVLFTLQKK